MQHRARRAAVAQTKGLSFCLWFCHTPNKSSVDAVGSTGSNTGKEHLALVPALRVPGRRASPGPQSAQAHKPRLALPAVPTRVELGNRRPAASRKILMVPQLPMASQGWHQSQGPPVTRSVSGWLCSISIAWITLLGPGNLEGSNTCVKMAIILAADTSPL